jgi:hypothetical protein
MSQTEVSPALETEQEVPQEITLEELAQRLDALGMQMNWLCENMASLFGFVNQMGKNGGGIRGLMRTIKDATPPELKQQLEQEAPGL